MPDRAPLDPRKLPNVSSRYGAPMGRYADKVPADGLDWLAEVAPRSVHVARVTMSDGYDNGGAYWGIPHNLYLVQWRTDGGEWCRAFVRGASRAAVVRELAIPAELLARPVVAHA